MKQESCGLKWTESVDKSHPDKPGKERYEQIPCLVIYKKYNEPRVLVWNCEYLVWDDESADDFFCSVEGVSAWIPLDDIVALRGKE